MQVIYIKHIQLQAIYISRCRYYMHINNIGLEYAEYSSEPD
jgi:hypothetical protein